MGTPGEGELSPTLHRKSSSIFPLGGGEPGAVYPPVRQSFWSTMREIFRFQNSPGLPIFKPVGRGRAQARPQYQAGPCRPDSLLAASQARSALRGFRWRSSSRGDTDPLAQFQVFSRPRCVQHGRTWGGTVTPGRDVELKALLRCLDFQKTFVLPGESRTHPRESRSTYELSTVESLAGH